MSPNHAFTLFIVIFILYFNDNDLTHVYEITKQTEFKKTKIKCNIHDITLLWFLNYSACYVRVNQSKGKEYMSISIFKMSITCSFSFTTSSRPESKTQTRNESSNFGGVFLNILGFNKTV